MIKDYSIKSGDTLTRIAKLTGTSVAELAKMNGIEDPDKIYVGDSLKVPDVAAMQQQAQVKQLLQQLMPQQPVSPQQGLQQQLLNPQPRQPTPQQRGPDPKMFNPQADAIRQSAPEMAMMPGPGMMRGAGNMAMGGLGAMARGMPAQTAKAGRIPTPQGYSNIVPMGNNGAVNSSMAQAMLQSRRPR